MRGGCPCIILTRCLLLFFHIHLTTAAIYLEDIRGALLYDDRQDLTLPNHFLSSDVGVFTHSHYVESETGSPSHAPSLQPSELINIFDRQLSAQLKDDETQDKPRQTSHSVSLPPFDDLRYIDNNAVYYDSKQARFGSDLGPRGNFEMGNLMLPPRGLWGNEVVVGDDVDLVGVDEIFQQKDDAIANNRTDEAANYTLIDDGAVANQTGVANETGINKVSNQTPNSSVANETDIHNIANGTIDSMPSNKTRATRLRQRKLESIDEFLGLAEPTNEQDSSILDADNLSVQTLNSFVGVTAHQQQSISHEHNATDTVLNVTSAWETYDNITRNNQMYISDYFCLEDFVHWKAQLQKCKQQQLQQQEPNITHTVTNATNSTDIENSTLEATIASETIKPCVNDQNSINLNNQKLANTPIYSNPNFINSTRPITILARRGRCTFESKAQMAMLLNEIFIAHGKSNRIAHIIVYNNRTNNVTSEEDEELIDMGLARQTFQASVQQQHHAEHGFNVGMLYVNSNSGQDLMRRIKDRERFTSVSPHLNVERLLTEKSIHGSKEKRFISDSLIEVEESTKGEYNDTIDTIQKEVYDPIITNGWFFPGTLTRFCFSCGPKGNYGFDIVIPDLTDDTLEDESWGNGWYSGGWENPSKESPPSVEDENGSSIYSPYGPFYMEQRVAEAIRKFMILVLSILLIGPFVFAAWRWRSVGGTVRLARDENGVRHLRFITPNMEEFVNGNNNTVERNGTKLDRAQVFALPEMKYLKVQEGGILSEPHLCEIGEQGSVIVGVENTPNSLMHDNSTPERQHPALAQSPPLPSTSLSDCLETGTFVSSTCCSICIEEFEHGEKLRVLPRCSHAFHTECILPWLTERQGCCPLCKRPVLPDELQRNRTVRSPSTDASSTSPRHRIMRSFFRQSALAENSNEVVVENVSEVSSSDLSASTSEQQQEIDYRLPEYDSAFHGSPITQDDAPIAQRNRDSQLFMDRSHPEELTAVAADNPNPDI